MGGIHYLCYACAVDREKTTRTLSDSVIQEKKNIGGDEKVFERPNKFETSWKLKLIRVIIDQI